MNLVSYLPQGLKTRAASYLVNAQVKNKPRNEDVLMRLFGWETLDFRSISGPLSNVLHARFGNNLRELGFGERRQITDLVQSILVISSYNIATTVYHEEVQRLERGEEVEAVPFEKFIADAIQHVFLLARDELIEIDEAVSCGVEPQAQLFSSLASQVLNFLIPENSGWTNWIIRPFLVNALSELLVQLYKKHFWKPSYNEDSGEVNLDEFEGIIATCMGPLCQGISDSLVKEEEAFQVEHELLEGISSSFVQPLHRLLIDVFPLAHSISVEQLQSLCSALLLRGIRNIARANQQQECDTFDEKMVVVVKYFRDRIFDHFLIINAKRESGERIKDKDFEPLAREFFETILSHDPQLSTLILRRFPQVIQFLTGPLHEFEESLHVNQNRAPDKERLRCLLGELVQDKLKEGESLLSEDLSRYLGVEEVVTQMENMCLHIGEAVLHHVEKFFSQRKSTKVLAHLLAPHFGGNAKMIKPVIHGLIPCIFGNDLQADCFKAFLKAQIAGVLFTVITNALEKGAERGDVADALFHGIDRLLSQFRKRTEEMPEGILTFFFVTEERPLGLKEYLPLPELLASKLSDAIGFSLLPRMLDILHKDSHLWIDGKDELREELDNDKMEELSRVLGRFVEQFLPYFLSEKSSVVAEALLGVTSSYLLQAPGQLTEESLSLNLEKEERPHAIWNRWLSQFFLRLGDRRNKNNRMLFSFIHKYTEGFLLKLFGNLRVCLERLDESDSEAQEHVHAAKILLEEGREHFKKVNEIKSSLREEQASKVSHKILVDHFALNTSLHPVLDSSRPSLSVGFYKEMGTYLLEVMDLDAKVGLPAPNFLKPIVWELFEDLLLPRIVESLIEEYKSTDAIHHYLHSLLTAVRESIENPNEEQEEVLLYEGELQDEIEDLSGAFLQELLGLQPTIAMPLLRYRKIQKLLGRAVGQSLRRALERFTTLDLFDRLIQSALPSLHKGRWVSKRAMAEYKRGKKAKLPEAEPVAERFLPIKINEEGIEVKGWDFGFPRTEKAKKKAKKESEEARAQITHSVTVELEEMIKQQADLSIDAAIHGVWNDIQVSFDESLALTFGPEGKGLKKKLDHVCAILWKFVFYPFLLGITFPFRKAAVSLLKIYYRQQAKARVEDVGHPIHQNFFLRSIERITRQLASKSH